MFTLAIFSNKSKIEERYSGEKNVSVFFSLQVKLCKYDNDSNEATMNIHI